MSMPADAGAPPRLVLVDGSGFIFRAFHALPPMTRPDGVPVNAVFGFTNMLARLLRDHAGTHLAVIFDAGRMTFRNRLYPAYKAHRPEPPEELRPQFALVRAATEAFAVPAIELADWEADDLIASYTAACRAVGGEVTIISSDKDLMQLIGPGVRMLDPIKQKKIGPDEVMEKFGVPPERLVEAQALMGDSVDNVPGVPGIGPKGAAQLINEFGDLEGVLAAAPSMKPSKRRDALIGNAEAARISRQLVELRADAPLPLPIEALAVRAPQPAVLLAWLVQQGFRSVATRLGLEESGEGAHHHEAEKLEAQARETTSLPAQAGFGPYVCVTEEAALADWIARARAAGVVGLDTETDGLDALTCRIVGFSLAVAPGEACYVPLRHVGAGEADPPAQIAPERAMALLGTLLIDPCVLKIFQNAKFDLLVLAGAGAPEAVAVDDSMLISYALEAGLHGHGLDELSRLHLGHSPIAYDEVTGTGRARISFAQVALDRATDYAAEDADIALRLWQALRPRLRGEHALVFYEQIDRRLIGVIGAMERAGILVDAAMLQRLSLDFGQRMELMQAAIHRLAGREFNLGSARQLGEILFEEMKLAGGKRTPSGAWSTDASVLQQLADEGNELPQQILDWRQLAKLKSTYTDALVEQINPATGRVHTSYAMAVAATGRLSSTDPNLQNIPIRTEEGGRIREAFIAAPGTLLISADYSQIELRLLAHAADIEALRTAFRRGEDIHARTASEVFGVPMADMDPLTRRRAKAINFGIIYGISAFGLGRQLQISPGEAKNFIDAYFARYPGIRAYMESCKEEARINGFVRTPFGRRCWIPGIADRNPVRRAGAERQAINAPLQGGAADIIKRAMVHLPGALAHAGLSARMLLQVHDELILEAPAEEAEATATLAREVMEAAASLSVPLVVETGIGANWGAAH